MGVLYLECYVSVRLKCKFHPKVMCHLVSLKEHSGHGLFCSYNKLVVTTLQCIVIWKGKVRVAA